MRRRATTRPVTRLTPRRFSYTDDADCAEFKNGTYEDTTDDDCGKPGIGSAPAAPLVKSDSDCGPAAGVLSTDSDCGKMGEIGGIQEDGDCGWGKSTGESDGDCGQAKGLFGDIYKDNDCTRKHEPGKPGTDSDCLATGDDGPDLPT